MNETKLPEPVQPEDWECCGSDCGDACTWDMYYRDKRLYDEQQKKLKQEQQGDAK